MTTRPRRRGNRPVGSKLLAAILDSSDDAIISKTLDGVVTTWNKAAERIYGYQEDEMIGHSISILIPPDRPNEMVEILDRLRIGERLDHYETTRLRKDGTTIAISLTASPILDTDGDLTGVLYNASVYKDAAGQVLGVVAAVRDVTAQKRAETEAAKQRARVFEKLAELERFQKLTVGRELRMIELKQELKDLRAAAGGQ